MSVVYPSLLVLEARVGSTPGRQGLSLTVTVGGSTWNSVHLDWWDLGADESGPLRADQHDWRYFQPPPAAAEAVARLCANLPVSDAAQPLWLSFARPSGILPLLPWESWLVPLAGRPILRLPYLSLDTERVVDRLDLAVCASQPAAKEAFPLPQLVEDTVGAFLAVNPSCRVHLFVGREELASLRPRFADAEAAGRVVVYDPSEARSYPLPAQRSELSGEEERGIDSPWLQWMLRSLEKTTLDAAHFICPTYFRDGRGALAFAESPMQNIDRVWARFVGPLQLAAFLDQTGAWALGIAPPADNLSPPGARAIADQVAQRRPGPVVLHDAEADPQGVQLTAAFRYLMRAAPPIAAGAVTLYSDPALVARERASSGRASRIARSSAVPLGRVRTASQRVLERSFAELESLAPSDSVAAAAAERGAQEALEFVADLLDKTEEPEG